MVRVYSATFTPRARCSSVRLAAGLARAARADRRRCSPRAPPAPRRSAIPLGAPLPAGLHLAYPWLYVVLAPLFTPVGRRLDAQHDAGCGAFSPASLVLYVAWRLARVLWRRLAWSDAPPIRGAAAPGARAAGRRRSRPWPLFIAGGLLWHRPMARLAGAGAGQPSCSTCTATPTSPTTCGARSCAASTPRPTCRWHGRAGFDAFFVTDHNTVGGPVRTAGAAGRSVPASRSARGRRTSSCWATRCRWTSAATTARSTRSARCWPTSDSAYGALSVLSLPEYERNHADRLDSLIAAGRGRLRDRERLAQGQRDLARAARLGDRAGAAHQPLRRGRERQPRLGRHQHGLESHADAGAAADRRRGLRRAAGRASAAASARRGSSSATGSAPTARWPAWLTPVGVVWETWRGDELAAHGRLARLDLAPVGGLAAGDILNAPLIHPGSPP